MFYIIKSQKIPHSYFEQSKEKGKIINFSYLVKKENENLVGEIAQIFLPFGYQETKPYNILYYLHGFGGTHEDLLSKNNNKDLIWLPISKGYHGYNTIFESFIIPFLYFRNNRPIINYKLFKQNYYGLQS